MATSSEQLATVCVHEAMAGRIKRWTSGTTRLKGDRFEMRQLLHASAVLNPVSWSPVRSATLGIEPKTQRAGRSGKCNTGAV
eukprot:2669591-Prymnesium_polylepis.2